jgi:amino acid adenylation domain-containing protein
VVGMKEFGGRVLAPKPEHSDLSFAQERVWFFERLAPGTAVYNLPFTIEMTGSLDAKALQDSLNQTIRRHEILRTTFEEFGGRPYQITAPFKPISMPIVDLSELSKTEQDVERRRLIEQEARQPFNLSSGELCRATLFRVGLGEALLLFTVHHIAFDGWSVPLLIDELVENYKAAVASMPFSQDRLPLQYADYARSQRAEVQGEVLERELRYWTNQLADAPTVFELPTDRVRPPTQSYEGATYHFTLSTHLSERINRLARASAASPYMTLLAAFGALLHRYTGSEDILIGSPIANRRRPETERLIGFFVNTLALRINLSSNPKFNELLSRVRLTALEAYAHQDLPFERLVKELRPERVLSHGPVFQVMFTLQSAMPSLELERINLRVKEVERSTSMFDITLFMTFTEGTFAGAFEYRLDLFDSAWITRLAGHFALMLESIASDPNKRISELSMLGDAESQEILAWCNRAVTPYPRQASIPELFEAEVERAPDAPALIFEQDRLSYLELNRRANRLARYLRSQGVRPDSPVAVCLERSIQLVVGLLAILKAGGAYVPLDPSYPKDRQAFILGDTRAGVLLTEQRFAGGLPNNTCRVVYVDKESDAIACEDSTNIDTILTPQNLAYVMYTSGSTGSPKGVCIPHAGVVRLVKSANYADLSSDQVFLQFAPISFDASTFEIWGSLLNGARLVIAPPGRLSIHDLAKITNECRVTVLWLTAGLFHETVESNIEDFRTLTHLLAGGDVLSGRHVAMARKLLPGCRVTNGYGPTEATTFTCCYDIPAFHIGQEPVPIGRPIANTEVYVLDRYLNLVPRGVIGELYIGGPGLARGYLNAPALTAEKFVPNPFSLDGGDRLYRTGDLGRLLSDGNVEFRGRIDNQVKVRGFRVEPNEIEAILQSHPSVRNSVVIAPQDILGRRLVAYVVLESQGSLTKRQVREFLSEMLPDYMVPSTFIFLESLPLTVNGKIDRSALPAPELANQRTEPAAERLTRVEIAVRDIWVEVLRLRNVSVSVHDNFFDLGGESLAATRLVSRIRTGLQVDLPVAAVFDRPTIREMALAVESKMGKRASQPSNT